MAELTYRTTTPTPPTTTTVKDQPLTYEEMDGNFKSINDDVALAKEQAVIYSIIFG
jgi:hypothetical protein